MNSKVVLKTLAGLLPVLVMLSCSGGKPELSEKIFLSGNWQVRPSGEMNLPGSVISGLIQDTTGWYEGVVPSTIMDVLTRNGLYRDIFMADSLKKVDRGQFSQSWWYRTVFNLPLPGKDQHVMLNFDGISYYANIWLNSKQVASRDSIYGAFRTFTFDITPLLNDSVNVLAVEVFRQQPGDFGLGFVDWNPPPPDNNMGLWRDVYLEITGDVEINHAWVRTDQLSGDLNEASLSVITELVNHGSTPVNGELTGKSEAFSFSVPVRLDGGETTKITLGPTDVKSLRVSRPRLWWCSNFGEPYLYSLDLAFITSDAVSDRRSVSFGIRTVETYMNESGHRGFKLNGKEVLIRGAGWTDNLFLCDMRGRDEMQVQYVRHMNLNTIRFESFWNNSRNVYRFCDQYGIMGMVGWSCQWEWPNYLGKDCDEYGGIRSEADMALIVESLGDQIRYLQDHPSIVVWMLGSDMLPRPKLEEKYRDLIQNMDDRPYVAAASTRTSEVSGPTGVKMNGPYNYVGPSYWYVDSLNGGAFGFNTETGPGPQVPVFESLCRMIPEDKRWPINETWNYHCNPSQVFGSLDIFNEVLNQRYGRPANLGQYMLRSDVQNYEAMKGMFEAFRANRPNATGIIQWMLNSAWPSFYWQLYDYYMLPTAAYYAARKANAPVQLIYNYGNNEIYAANETLERYEKVRARIRQFDVRGKETLSEELVMAMEPNRSARIFTLPPLNGISFLSLTIFNDRNTEIAENFYWLPGNRDEYSWDKTEWYYTPMQRSVDFRPLNYLAQSAPEMSLKVSGEDGNRVLEVDLANKSVVPAFFMNMALKDGNGQTVFPVFWDDNYLCLMPGENKLVKCTIPGSHAGGNYTLSLSGWNVKELSKTIEL